MKAFALALLSLSATFADAATAKEMKYPPLEEYLMARNDEIALARSAAPKAVSDLATIKVLTKVGYELAVEGTNGAVCLVMRGWSGVGFTTDTYPVAYDAKVRAPICFDPRAAQTILPQEELRANLALKGVAPEDIGKALAMAYATGDLPKMEGVAFGYMWSRDQDVGVDDQWHPHMMIYAPYYENSMLGGHAPASGLPSVVINEGSPFALVVVAVDDKYAIDADLQQSKKHH
jgi:hypothetical protein